eukprot:1957962-Ditylum_brightwellii.AAC.1
MASLLVVRLATLVIRALDRSIANDTLDALVAQGDRQVLKVAHHVHVIVAVFHPFFDLVSDKCVEILDLFACHAALFGPPFGVLDKLDLPEPLLFCDVAHGLNLLLWACTKLHLSLS